MTFEEILSELVENIKSMPVEMKIEAINKTKSALHQVSPFKDEPVDCVLWVRSESVVPNDYNPNTVPPPEMRLLQHSIDHDHYTQPVVTWKNEKAFYIVDGEHRYLIGTTVKKIQRRLMGYLPITAINASRGNHADRMASTIRHNRARGVHAVSSMTDIVATMLGEGMDDEGVACELGMDADEFLRFKQNTGMPELFKDHDYSKAWESEIEGRDVQ